MINITLKINGEGHQLKVRPHWTLLYVLREELGLTGTKLSCGTGECGACTVLMDGRAVSSCLILAASAEGREITTIEGLSQGDELHPLQSSFVKHGAIQCGFCTPGMIMSAKALLDENPEPTRAEVREAIAGNLCRCTGYVKIVEAIMDAARVLREGSSR
jgi:carbon-monoxide dehydrogenase small subunit